MFQPPRFQQSCGIMGEILSWNEFLTTEREREMICIIFFFLLQILAWIGVILLTVRTQTLCWHRSKGSTFKGCNSHLAAYYSTSVVDRHSSGGDGGVWWWYFNHSKTGLLLKNCLCGCAISCLLASLLSCCLDCFHTALTAGCSLFFSVFCLFVLFVCCCLCYHGNACIQPVFTNTAVCWSAEPQQNWKENAERHHM